MGKRGPKRGTGGRPSSGKYPEEQRKLWRERKHQPTHKAEREEIKKQLAEDSTKLAKEMEDKLKDFVPLQRFVDRFLNVYHADDASGAAQKEIKEMDERRKQLIKQIGELNVDIKQNKQQQKNELLQFLDDLPLRRKINNLLHEIELEDMFFYGLDFALDLVGKKIMEEKQKNVQ
jgi:hypothetical protein